ncbi:hypothetical protein AVEN_12726-1 [Araneus ventricosus]|uniref:Uncharacterized protein n=1 Tax=Araneus ventricosus TaxID=182803 RepID=A0A4Y2AB14_ARAVE|nr:hypothetical protein AVEN_12726-1 [Araneus ventricosus]
MREKLYSRTRRINPNYRNSGNVGLRVERRHHLQSVCLQDVVLVDQTDEKSVYKNNNTVSWSVLQHPPCSPDLAPSDFHMFGPLKQHHGGKYFADDDDVQHEVLLWMRQQPKEFYAAGIWALLKRWIDASALVEIMLKNKIVSK